MRISDVAVDDDSFLQIMIARIPETGFPFCAVNGELVLQGKTVYIFHNTIWGKCFPFTVIMF